MSDLQTQLENERRLVSFDSYDLSVGQLLDMVSAGAIFVPPEYQRQFIWDPTRQSTLIESVFLGIPVPSLFMATNADATWEVVDGVQRLGTLCHFVGSPALLQTIDRPAALRISGLNKLTSLNKLTYDELPKSIQLRFNTRPIRVTVLNDKSDLSVRFDLFERLNTGGILLTAQEIRNCVYRGPYNDDIKKMAGYPAFRDSVKFADVNKNNGLHEELVLRFLAYLHSYQTFDHSVKDFLNEHMKKYQRAPVLKKDSDLFEQVFTILKASLPGGIVRRGKTPVNLYEAVAVGTALAVLNGANVQQKSFEPLLSDEALRKFTGAGTNTKRMVIGRIEFVRDYLS